MDKNARPSQSASHVHVFLVVGSEEESSHPHHRHPTNDNILITYDMYAVVAHVTDVGVVNLVSFCLTPENGEGGKNGSPIADNPTHIFIFMLGGTRNITNLLSAHQRADYLYQLRR